MDCGAAIVKYILFIFNMLCVVCGILLITFGSIILSRLGGVKDFSEAYYTNSIPIFIIVLGIIIFIISFVGCCGAIREDTCLTMTYSVFMLVLLILQMILVVFIWVQRESFLQTMNKAVDKMWEQRNNDGHIMDVLQLGLDCCGKNGPRDYLMAVEDVPNSCCGSSATTCSLISAAGKQGCSAAFRGFWETNIKITQFAGLVVAAIELVAFIFACCIANQIRNERRRAVY